METEEILQFGEFEVDPLRRSLCRNATPIPVNRRAFDVLLYLIRHPGEVISKHELLKNVWADVSVEENNLTQSISALRRALAERPGEHACITTVPGRGYQFSAAVRAVPLSQSLAVSASADPSPQGTGLLLHHHTVTTIVTQQEQRSSRRLHWPVALAVAIAAALIAGGYAVWRHIHPKPTEAAVIVAELLNATGDPDFDHILHRALEIDLGQSPYMDVMSERAIVAQLQLMGRPADASLSEDLARQVCVRDNRQAVLSGGIATIGSKYLLTLEATACDTGKKLASAKAEAASKEEVLNALDTVAERVRSKLGESAKSLSSFQVPIAQVTTPSLEALKAYSLGRYLDVQGRPGAEAMSCYQQAVALDPNFAGAYGELATHYYNLNEYRLASQYYKKAFDLSGHVGAKEQFIIRAHYYAEGMGDRLLGIKTYQVWAATYPLEWVPWLNLSNQYTQLGQYEPAVQAGRQALQRAQNPSTYIVLARAYKRAGRFTEAKAIAGQAIQAGKASDSMHALLYEIAVVEKDAAAMAQQVSWSKDHPGWYFLDYQANAASVAGRYKQASDFFGQSYAAAQRDELAETADDVLEDQAILELRLGLAASARATLERISTANRDTGEEAIFRAELGDTAFAGRFLTAHSKDAASDTDMTFILLPQLNAVLAMHQNKPLQAIAALEHSTPYDLASYSILSERGAAYLKAGQARDAAEQYRKVLANPGINGIDVLYPLAHLGLARSLAKAGDAAASRSEYAAFLYEWKDADADLPVLRAAKVEYAALPNR